MAGIVIGGSPIVCPSCGADIKRSNITGINADGNNPNNSFAYGRVLFRCGHDMETEPGKTVHHTPCPEALTVSSIRIQFPNEGDGGVTISGSENSFGAITIRGGK